jgi:hypothetical protein
MPAYTVGQVVYLLQTKSFSVVPVQVVEQITKNTLNGSETVYNVKIPGKKEMLVLSSFEGEVFDDLVEVKAYMIKNVTSNIEKMVHQAAQLANQHFPNSSEKETAMFNSETKPDTDQYDQIKVELADGQMANVTLPPEFRD